MKLSLIPIVVGVVLACLAAGPCSAHSTAVSAVNQEPFENVKVIGSAQTGIVSLNITNSARQAAMGNSGAADPCCLTSFRSNPAAMEASGLAAYYHYRFMDYLESQSEGLYPEGAHSYSAGAIIRRGRMNLALDYSRFEQGKFSGMRTVFVPEGYDDIVFEPYWHALTVASSFRLFKELSGGAALKYQSLGGIPWFDYEGAFSIDLGLFYGTSGFLGGGPVRDRFRLGLSFQNTGSSLKVSDMEMELPRYLRVGLSYKLTGNTEEDEQLFRIVFSGEYRRYTNKEENYAAETDYYGLGLEGRVYQWICLRAGGGNDPVYGQSNRFNPAIGIGVDIPLSGFGMDLPLEMIIDYTYLFLEDSEYDNFLSISLTSSQPVF